MRSFYFTCYHVHTEIDKNYNTIKPRGMIHQPLFCNSSKLIQKNISKWKSSELHTLEYSCHDFSCFPIAIYVLCRFLRFSCKNVKLFFKFHFIVAFFIGLYRLRSLLAPFLKSIPFVFVFMSFKIASRIFEFVLPHCVFIFFSCM